MYFGQGNAYLASTSYPVSHFPELISHRTNFLRYCVLQIFHRTTRHLQKVANVDEMLRRITSVLNSNDPGKLRSVRATRERRTSLTFPVARALTLRALATMPQLVSSRKFIHHGYTTSSLRHTASHYVTPQCQRSDSLTLRNQHPQMHDQHEPDRNRSCAACCRRAVRAFSQFLRKRP
jgi:hypothetical protein